MVEKNTSMQSCIACIVFCGRKGKKYVGKRLNRVIAGRKRDKCAKFGEKSWKNEIQVIQLYFGCILTVAYG